MTPDPHAANDSTVSTSLVSSATARQWTEEPRTTASMIAAVSAEIDQLEQQVHTSGDQVGALSNLADPVAAKNAMAQAATIAEGALERLKAKQAELKKLLDQQMREMQHRLSPLEKRVSELREGVWSVNLYLGREEAFVPIRGGEPAPADSPIVVRQMVLAMDEECMVEAERGGIETVEPWKFDHWLLEDPAHVQQVIPEEKCVVALRPRSTPKTHTNPWEEFEKNSDLATTHFLIRNGERLYRYTTDFYVGDRLMPDPTEFTAFFEERTYGRPLQPGSPAWVKAEEKADDRRRHYMRVALILQGLIDRHTVFHPLPDEGVSFMDSKSHERGAVRFILDGSGGLDSGEQSYTDWQRDAMKRLRPGMRVVGAFHTHSWAMLQRESRSVEPKGASNPPSNVPLVVERGEDGENRRWRVRYRETQERWIGGGWDGELRIPRKRASAYFGTWEDAVLPIDLVSEEQLRQFVRSRQNRRGYAEMIPVIKAAITVKREEAAAEEPFRTMLLGTLARENNVAVADVEDDIDQLIATYKNGRSVYRPLRSDDDRDQDAVRAIVKSHAALLARKQLPENPALLDELAKRHSDAIVIARKTDGTWLVYTPENRENVFTREHLYTKTGKPKTVRRWVPIDTKSLRIERTFHRYENWTTETPDPWTDLTDPQKEQLADDAWENFTSRASTSHYHGEPWGSREDETKRAIPVAVTLRDDNSKVNYKAIIVWYATNLRTLEDPEAATARTEFFGQQYGWTVSGKSVQLGYGHRYGVRVGSGKDDRPWDGELLRLDEQALSRYHSALGISKERLKKLDHERESRMRFVERITRRWLQREADALKAKFVDDHGSDQLWEHHVAYNGLPDRVPGKVSAAASHLGSFLTGRNVDVRAVDLSNIVSLTSAYGYSPDDTDAFEAIVTLVGEQ